MDTPARDANLGEIRPAATGRIDFVGC